MIQTAFNQIVDQAAQLNAQLEDFKVNDIRRSVVNRFQSSQNVLTERVSQLTSIRSIKDLGEVLNSLAPQSQETASAPSEESVAQAAHAAEEDSIEPISEDAIETQDDAIDPPSELLEEPDHTESAFSLNLMTRLEKIQDVAKGFNLLRPRRISELETSYQLLSEQVQRLEARLNDTQREEQLKEHIELLNAQVKSLKNQLSSLKGQFTKLRNQLNS